MMKNCPSVREHRLLKRSFPRLSLTHVISIMIALVAIDFLSTARTAPISTTDTVRTLHRRHMLDIPLTDSRPEFTKSRRSRSQSPISRTPKSSFSPSPEASPNREEPTAADPTHVSPTPHAAHITSSAVSTLNPEADPASTPSNPTPFTSRSPDTQSGKTTPPDRTQEALTPRPKPSQSTLPPPEPTITPVPQQKPPSGSGDTSNGSGGTDGKETTTADSEGSPRKKNQSGTSNQEPSSGLPSLSTSRIVLPLFIVGAGLSILVSSVFFVHRSGLCIHLRSALSEQPYEPVQPEPSSSTMPGNTNGTTDADGWNQDWDVDDWDVDENRTKRGQPSSQVF